MQSTSRGDVNSDGKVNAVDITKIAAHIKGLKTLTGDQKVNADVNFDGKGNAGDITSIAAHIKGLKKLPSDPDSADETFEGYDAFLMFADSEMNWGNWNGQGYHGVPSYGIDADITADGEYTVSITRESITASDDAGSNSSLIYYEYGDGEKELASASGCTMLCVDITGLLDGTLAADGNELEGFLSDGSEPNINKKVKGKYRGDELKVELMDIQVDGWSIQFDPSKVKYGNLNEEDNCYRIQIADLLSGSAEKAAIETDDLYFSNSLSVTFNISGIEQKKE